MRLSTVLTLRRIAVSGTYLDTPGPNLFRSRGGWDQIWPLLLQIVQLFKNRIGAQTQTESLNGDHLWLFNIDPEAQNGWFWPTRLSCVFSLSGGPRIVLRACLNDSIVLYFQSILWLICKYISTNCSSVSVALYLLAIRAIWALGSQVACSH